MGPQDATQSRTGQGRDENTYPSTARDGLHKEPVSENQTRETRQDKKGFGDSREFGHPPLVHVRSAPLADDFEGKNRDRDHPAQRGYQSNSENQGKGPGAEATDRQDTGNEGQVGDDRSRSRANRHFPWFSDRGCGLDVSRPDERTELPGPGPAGRGIPQDRIGKPDRRVCPKVPEFVEYYRNGKGDCPTNHPCQPPRATQPLPNHARSSPGERRPRATSSLFSAPKPAHRYALACRGNPGSYTSLM